MKSSTGEECKWPLAGRQRGSTPKQKVPKSTHKVCMAVELQKYSEGDTLSRTAEREERTAEREERDKKKIQSRTSVVCVPKRVEGTKIQEKREEKREVKKEEKGMKKGKKKRKEKQRGQKG